MANDLKYYLSADHFKVGHFGDKHVKRINLGLFISGIVIIVTLIFYILMYSFTNFSALDDLEDYATDFNQHQDTEFANMNFAAKIMPSYNFKENAIWLDSTRSTEDTIIPGAQTLSESLNLNNTYMRISDTPNVFPKFKYSENNIPVGNSMLLCVSLHWANKEKGQNFDLTQQVNGFPQCEESKSGAFIWNSEDPVNGIDVPAWTQKETDVDCTDTEDCISTCADLDGLYLNGKRGKKCFSYEILTSICIIANYDPVKNEVVYEGGCFEGGKHYLTEKPVKDQIYYFNKVKIELRNSNDPVIKAGSMSDYSYSFGASMNWLAIILNVFFWLSLLVFGGAIGLIFYYKHQNKAENNASLNADGDKELNQDD
jgi:hypothetical protein